jgi:hypothetical protein
MPKGDPLLDAGKCTGWGLRSAAYIRKFGFIPKFRKVPASPLRPESSSRSPISRQIDTETPCARLPIRFKFRTDQVAQRIYRDPVHNIIALRDESAEEQLMIRLIDTPEFQRLRRIKQLGLGLFTYQGAEHSRFTHSLGALHLMTRILDQLSLSAGIALNDS